ncbi:hypothetical protein BDK89_1049 [Ilumatobacter fluminis]|uniref:Cupin type-2 domain-containing protein n=1 Tax=Ilumatobacter fluminis TaxID=467091 RepID=A0A4V3EJ04_9ACTN|nr:cupin domain-containing protein [Ilumatobacter fluminis]TDT15478.1 hypothetical protein BDK89_1049 [Ilumatobacter fluminis]
MEARSHHPDRTYPHLAAGPDLTLIDVGPDFWATIDDRPELHTGRLVTSFEMNADWDVWEMHPKGDELILVTEGKVRFRLDDDATVAELVVEAPEYVIVPTGVWHTADAMGPARLVIITWGDGTTHRPR